MSHQYAAGVLTEHVKMEVTAGISEQEAASVRVTAADAARAVARQEMDLLSGLQATPPRLRRCGIGATPQPSISLSKSYTIMRKNGPSLKFS